MLLGNLDSMKPGERLLEVVFGDLVFVDVEAVEDRLVQ